MTDLSTGPSTGRNTKESFKIHEEGGKSPVITGQSGQAYSVGVQCLFIPCEVSTDINAQRDTVLKDAPTPLTTSKLENVQARSQQHTDAVIKRPVSSADKKVCSPYTSTQPTLDSDVKSPRLLPPAWE